MLHTIDRAGRDAAFDDTLLRKMFAARKRVFVDLLKWEIPVLAGQYEVDQFDDPHATYLILADDDGRHRGSARLLPTIRPHLLDSIFPQLCDGEPPRAESTYEITRFCLDSAQTARERFTARVSLVTALIDHALANRITIYTGVAEMGWFSQVLAFGWHCVPLGLPRVIGGSTLVGLSIAIDEQTPERCARAGYYRRADTIPHAARRAA